MAAVDLYGGDAEQIRNAYKTNLGREASQDEVSNWLSGAYGGGGTNDWLNQIATSGEAQAYKQPQQSQQDGSVIGQNPGVSNTMPIGGGGYDQVASWYQDALGRAGSQDEINNWLSGAYGWGNSQNLSGIRSGIYGSSEAAGRQAQPTSTTGATPNGSGDLEAWLRSMLTGASSPQALAALEPQLTQRGIRLQKDSDGNIRGRLYLPNGQTLDVVNQWGAPWAFTNRGAGGPSGSGAPSSQYSDPYTKFLEQLLTGRIGALMQGVNDPNRAAYNAALQQRAASLGAAGTQEQQLMDYLQKRFQDLQGPGYTGAENEAIRTGALDPIETDRQAARKRVMERLSARGLTPDSGIAQQALLEVDKAFDAMRGATQTALTTNDLNRREDRQTRAQTIGAELVDIPQQRAREQLDVYGALNQLSQLARQEDEARQREAVGYGGALADLGPQRLQLAMQAAGMGGNPSSMFSNLMQLAGLNQNASLYGANNQSSLWSGLGSLAAMLYNSGQP